jgi:myosin heavy subunit
LFCCRQVAQALPLIKAELGDQQALLTACNQFLEDMAERHLSLLLQQQQSEARLATTRPNTPNTAAAAGHELMDLQAVTELQLQLREASAHLEELELEQARELHEVTVQLEQQKKQAEELLQQKELLRSQLRVVTMEREELKQQLMEQAEADAASAAAAQLQDTLQQLSDAQEKLVAAEQKVADALDSNQQLTEQLAKAQTAAEVAKASALAATSSASAATHAQLQEASAKVATLEEQLVASEQQLVVSEQRAAAVAGSNELLQQQLAEAHAQGGRLISMNRQLMQHAEVLETKVHQQAALVAELQEDKAASAAELAGIYMMLQEMQGVQQRQQLLQQQLLQIISKQHKQAQPGDTANSTAGSDISAAAATAEGPAAEQEGEDGANSLVKALSGAVFGAALPLVGIFLK